MKTEYTVSISIVVPTTQTTHQVFSLSRESIFHALISEQGRYGFTWIPYIGPIIELFPLAD